MIRKILNRIRRPKASSALSIFNRSLRLLEEVAAHEQATLDRTTAKMEKLTTESINASARLAEANHFHSKIKGILA